MECVENDFSMCRTFMSSNGIFYNNRTSFPNVYDHINGNQARDFLQGSMLLRLVDLNCSPYTRHLVCSAVFPLCYDGLFQRVEPCREMCEAVKEGCEEVLWERERKLWPSELNCTQLFQPYGTKVCIWNGSANCTAGSGNKNPATTQRISTTTAQRPHNNSSFISVATNCTGRLTQINKTQGKFGGLSGCVEPCGGVYFEHNQNTLITLWTAVLNTFSLIISVLIFLTYILNYRSISRLETSIYYIALCYAILGLTNLVSAAIGRNEVSCNHAFQNSYNQSILNTSGSSSPLCMVLFCLVYYFTLCTWSWWMVLSLEWSLCSIGSRHVGRLWKVTLHILAWVTPFFLLLLVIITDEYSGDPLTQGCWIRKEHKIPFVIAPLSVTILICSTLIIISFARVVHLQDKKFKKLTNLNNSPETQIDPSLLIRVGTYITFYLVPMSTLLCCYFYDYWYREAWERIYLNCSSSSSLQACNNVPSSSKPSLVAYMTLNFSSICMGFISIFWLLRQKSLFGWKMVCCVCCFLKSNHYNSTVRHRSSPTESDHLEAKGGENDYPDTKGVDIQSTEL